MRNDFCNTTSKALCQMKLIQQWCRGALCRQSPSIGRRGWSRSASADTRIHLQLIQQRCRGVVSPLHQYCNVGVYIHICIYMYNIYIYIYIHVHIHIFDIYIYIYIYIYTHIDHIYMYMYIYAETTTMQGCLVSPISVKWQKGLVPICIC